MPDRIEKIIRKYERKTKVRSSKNTINIQQDQNADRFQEKHREAKAPTMTPAAQVSEMIEKWNFRIKVFCWMWEEYKSISMLFFVGATKP